MEITNLMLNDYVMIHCFDGSDIVIKVTRIEGEGCTVYGISKQGSHWANIEDVRPIPITPEILEKNGFYYGYTSNEEDLASNTIAQLSEEDKGWVWDEGAGSVKVIFPNESDGGEIQISDQCFDRNMTFSFVENIMFHELQHALKLCRVKKEIEL